MIGPVLTVDIIIECSDGAIVFVQRKNEPFKGEWALPGGLVDVGETVEQAAVREAKEETGLQVELQGFVGVYSDPERDPRGHFVSLAFAARPTGGSLRAASDAAAAMKTREFAQLKLAFDHRKILADFLSRRDRGR